MTSEQTAAASCSKTGTTVFTAKVTFGGKQYTNSVTQTVPATGKHSFGSWETTKEPDCTQNGEQIRKCTNAGCTAYETKKLDALGHYMTSKVIAPTSSEQGYTLHTCTRQGCTYSYKDNYTAKLSERVYGSSRFDTAFAIADQIKKANGGEAFKSIIIASGTDFADALSASYLAKVKNAPILITAKSAATMDSVAEYVKKNAAPKANIYIVGGTGAVLPEMETKLKGYNVKRLAGKNRFLTNIEVLKESKVTNEEILVASGLNYADALSASAVGKPILLVAGKSLTADQTAYLKTIKSTSAAIIGGTGAVSSEIEKQVKSSFKSVTRVGGSNRFETSVLVAKRYFKNPPTMAVAYGLNYPDGLCGGPLAMQYSCPLILTVSANVTAAKDYAKQIKATTTVTFGGPSLITDEALKTILG